MACTIRGIRTSQYTALEEFPYGAVFVPPRTPSPDRNVLQHPDIALYTGGFGAQPDDHGLVALVGDTIVGAVWARIMEDYGHVDDETPWLAMSVLPAHRGRGIGADLLRRMLKHLRGKGYWQVSLSVQKANYAVWLYTKAGFTVYRRNADDLIMVCALQKENV
ncbi:MAG: GNAT family N-acetyltransferase [Clostridiales bacterium]|nr:GNAT family N-acetyltransferase [Clostridiales bacterium]